MSSREKFLSNGLGISAFALCAILVGQQPVSNSVVAYAALPLGASISLSTPEPTSALFDRQDASVRTALRLQERLRRKGLPATLENAVSAVRERQHFLRQSVRVHFLTETGSGATWVASAQQFPLWILMNADAGGIHIELNPERIHEAITDERLRTVATPRNITITGMYDGKTVDRVLTDGAARPGHRLDTSQTRDLLIQALTNNQTAINVQLLFTPGHIENLSGVPLGDLTLLATGHSNFKGSPWGRIANVRKALREHVQNAIVAPGEIFSFNTALGDAMIKGGRWEQAKVINGGVLTMEQGGGICQASTTLYRGLLAAGLPVLKRTSHSMYVSYYEEGGVGLDATVYKGNPDLTFLNDTGNFIVLQAYDDGDDAYIHIYGTPDGRSATIDGPYFTQTAPDDFAIAGRPLKRNEIGWRHEVTYADGAVKNDTIISTYKTLPNSIVNKYTAITAAKKIVALGAGQQ
ncbi:MAG: VanW family protein [Candidatus Peregrinibacteria bacterium Greene0416_62]|nr:MAG: VanW family protein [Candidatus Peregrinibacteria bacterium Greene0416_62]TSC97614.1 MAG: VanW family protein [Candidatus Peregrinibacteria bacterium Greene1014_49]